MMLRKIYSWWPHSLKILELPWIFEMSLNILELPGKLHIFASMSLNVLEFYLSSLAKKLSSHFWKWTSSQRFKIAYLLVIILPVITHFKNFACGARLFVFFFNIIISDVCSRNIVWPNPFLNKGVWGGATLKISWVILVHFSIILKEYAGPLKAPLFHAFCVVGGQSVPGVCIHKTLSVCYWHQKLPVMLVLEVPFKEKWSFPLFSLYQKTIKLGELVWNKRGRDT